MEPGSHQANVTEVAIGIVVDKVSPESTSNELPESQPANSISEEHQRRILITRRKADQVLGGLWELPGGKLEPGESPADAVVRELLEEVGIDVAPLATLGPVEHHYEHAHVRLIPFICNHLAGDPQPLHVDEARWVNPDQLTDYAFPDASLPILDELLRWLDDNP